MAKKQNLLKNLLTSVSVASIVASIGGSSGAFTHINIGGANTDLSAILATDRFADDCVPRVQRKLHEAISVN